MAYEEAVLSVILFAYGYGECACYVAELAYQGKQQGEGVWHGSFERVHPPVLDVHVKRVFPPEECAP